MTIAASHTTISRPTASRPLARMFATSVASSMLLGLATLAHAQDIQPPSDPVAKAAFDVLDKHCARCHQEGKLTGRERPAKNFGNVLDLNAIAANPHYILPGNAFGSKLVKQIADKEMPYDVNYEGATNQPSVSEADLKALETWIVSLGTKTASACSSHKFITPEAAMGMIAADLDQLPRPRRINTRYLTLTHLANVCADEQAMKVYRQGAVKLINSLSRSSDVVKLDTIDPEGTIIRINIADLGWDAKDWDEVLAVYPYNMQPDSQLSAAFVNATGTELPYVRADWFAFTAAQPPLYDKLLKLAPNFAGLLRDQGIDIEANIRNFVAQRAGFQKSGVSQNNRLIERHPSRSGYFWTSYDFAGNQGHQSLFEHPMGPSGPDAFRHDGGETIFSLPNGFQGYYLNTAKGDKLDKGPTTIVRDTTRKDFAVTNGISCMGCHDQGMRKAKDDIREVAANNRHFSRETREAIEALYPSHEKMDTLIDSDAKRFADAMTRAGLDPTLKLNGVEMINALAKRYEDDVDLTLAAAEFGLDKDGFAKASKDSDRKYRTMVRRLEQGSVPRDQFELMYRELAADLTDLKQVRIAGAKQFKPGVHVAGASDLSLTSDQDVYRQGDTPVFSIVSPRDCYLTLTNVDERGEGTVLLPNKFQQNNFIRAGQAVQFPGANAPFQYRMKDRGTETVIAVCAEQGGGAVDGIRHDFGKVAFTPVNNYTRSVARSIAVEAAPGAIAQPGTAPKPVTLAAPRPQGPGVGRLSFRAAIKLNVR